MKNFLAKSTASDGGSKPAYLAHVPDRKQASQAGLELPYEALDLAKKKISSTHFVHRTFRQLALAVETV